MSTFDISHVDETLIHIKSDDSGAIMDLSEHYTFYVDGYKFMPAYRNKMWDGKIRLLNMRNNTLPYGLLPKTLNFAKDVGYGINLCSTIKNKEVIDKDELNEFATSQKLRAGGKEIELRDYQYDAFIHGISEGRSLIISPTGSGKSLIIYLYVKWYIENHDDNVLIIVPTTSLVEQMSKDFADYSSHDGSFDADTEIHKIYSGKEKENFDARIVISTWQSAINLRPGWFQQYGMIIGDEAHLFKAKSLNKIMGMLVNASYRIGTTGTLDGSLCNELVLIGNFGPTFNVTSTKKLIDDKTLADLEIKCIVCNHDDTLKKAVVKMDYQSEIATIVEHPNRNKFITKLALDQKGNTLVLFNLVKKHGKPLFKMIQDGSDDSDKIFYVSGEIKADDRENIRSIVDSNPLTTTLQFEDKEVKVSQGFMVPLTDGSKKMACELTTDDDISNDWILKNC
jgi:superfamily II DNA or RNA helicase